MTSLVKAILGLIVNKGRDLAAEKLKDGDVKDQQFRNLVVREHDVIKSKIDGLARKDLLASLSFFKEGLEFLYQLLDQQELEKFDSDIALPEKEDEKLAVSLPSASGGSKRSVNTRSLVEEVKMLKLDELNETAKQLFARAKKRFEEARIEATRAFNNEALQLVDCVLAMKIRIMATLLEKVDNPNTSLGSCRLCLEELHNILSVQNCFEVETTKPLMKYRFNQNERRKLIAEVCHMNFVVYIVIKMVGVDWRDVFKLPVIDIRTLKIDPLRDSRLIKALKEFKLERCCLVWTFGQEGERNHRLNGPLGITTNTRAHFIVSDYRDVKVFNSSGKFLLSFFDLTDDEQEQTQFGLTNVATDGNDSVYVLASLQKEERRGVYVFDQQYNLLHKFPLRGGVNIYILLSSVTVSNEGRVFVVVKCNGVPQVDVYENNGQFTHSFGQGILLSPDSDITTANDGRVMVLYRDTHCVNVFSTQGDHLHQFTVQGNTADGAIAFHQPSEHVIVSSWNPDIEKRGQVSIYTKDGEFVRCVQVDTDKKPWLPGLTVTGNGRVAVINRSQVKVHVIKLFN